MAGSSEIKEEYTSSLQDLKFNSKPLISVLTILAEENVAHAKDIVEAIEAHLSRVRTEVKLPVLYLIDCIIKNVGGPYTALFCQNIVSTFCSVFEQVDERTRAEMFRLRQTWNDVIPPKKLYALDVQITQLDPAWPVTAPPPSSIHFNPKFLKNTTTTVSSSTTATSSIAKSNALMSTKNAGGMDSKTLNMQQKLINKQKELLELQQRKLQLELLQTQVKLQEQQLLQNTNTSASTMANVAHSKNLLLKSEVAKQLAVSGATSRTSNNATNTKPKTGTYIASRLQNHNTGGPKIAPVNSNLTNARAIRDPRLLRHQQHQQPQQQQPQILSATVNSNVHLESKSKSGTQVTVESDNNKIVNNKTSVRNDRIELRLVNNKGNIESHGKSKISPHSSPLKHTQKIGIRKTSKFSRDSKTSNNSLSDLAISKNSSSSLGSPLKNNKSNPSMRVRSLSKPSIVKSKRKGAVAHSNKDSSVSRSIKDTLLSSLDQDGSSVCYDKSNSALFRIDNSAVNRADKKSDKQLKIIKSEKERKLRKIEATTFKDLKGSTKNRNYIRHNRSTSVSPEPSHDVDLRLGGPPEKQPRIQGDVVDEKNGSVDEAITNMDVDLRQLPSVIGKKRPTETGESSNTKKSKSEMFDELFGNEDIDLRPLPPVLSSPTGIDRPPTPPPPIISEKVDKTTLDSPNPKERKEPENKKELQSKNTKLDALRAKLANAVNQDKLKEPKELGDINSERAKRPKLHVDTDMRKLSSFGNHSDTSMTKIIISPADEECIKTGNMTKAQEKALMNKIIAQIETQKLREAQRKESESIENISLQPISDDEFDVDFSGSESESESQRRSSDFTDKDDRIHDDDCIIEERHNDERIKENRVPPIPPQLSLLEDVYPKYSKSLEHRDPRRGRPWRGRHRKAWEPLVPPPMARPGIRPFRPAPEPWNRPVNEAWRSLGGPPVYPNNFGSNSNSQDIPALEYAHPDSYKFITIDNEPREIRYYDETAIVFMNAGDPREITFHNGTRRIFFDGEPYMLKLNSPYEEISVKGNIHRVRLGAPSREIFIDGNGYECYFDQNEKIIDLDGNKIVVKLEPPPPQVKIGQEQRLDLVAGKVQLVVDAKNMYTVFLDAKPQTFEIDGVSHTLKFMDSLRAVLINDVRFEVEFGGLPKPVVLYDKKHFIRFSVLPKGIKPGHINIKDMEISQFPESSKNDNEENSQDGQTQTSYGSVESIPFINKKRPFEGDSPDRNSNSPQQFQNLLQHQNFNNLDMLSSVMASSMLPTTNEGQGYSVEKASISEMASDIQSNNSVNISSVVPKEAAVPSALNINDLFQRLVATGIVTTAATSQPEEPPPASPPKFSRNINNQKNLKPVLFGKPETLKVRRPTLIQSLYTGMQCSSCGMRFPLEQSMHYSQHLDWHFRQNRKGKRNIRKATSRRWYYSFSDWKNYEEIEDLEEREKSYFENQQQNQADGTNEEGEEEVEIPCVPADPKVQDAACEVCRDKFEQFYNEEKDEWQLRMAIRIDNKTYHPLCYEDYKASFVDETLEESKLDAILEKDTESCGIPGLEITDSEIDKEETKPDTEDDDVMEVIENIDDEETPPLLEKADENAEVAEEDGDDDDDVIINEIVPEKIIVDDDDKDDYTPSDCLLPGVVVKEEPIDDGFVDVEGGLIKAKEINVKAEPTDNDEAETIASEVKNVADTTDTTHTEVVSSMDGNVEFDCSVPAVASSISGKIKINITKPIPAIVPKESKDLTSEELKSDCIDPTQPLPPGEEPVQLNVKPALQGLELRRQPIVKKGSELTGLCSIM